jgi:antitoxin (DNA-binding transcriptional repressor) of toxin-antitoxin stability system
MWSIVGFLQMRKPIPQDPVTITKRGKPLAQVVPYRKSVSKPTPGKLADAFVFEKNIITPLGEGLWEACQTQICPSHTLDSLPFNHTTKAVP